MRYLIYLALCTLFISCNKDDDPATIELEYLGNENIVDSYVLLNIKSPADNILDLKIYNRSGTELIHLEDIIIDKAGNHDIEVDMKPFPEGVYYLILNDKYGVELEGTLTKIDQ